VTFKDLKKRVSLEVSQEQSRLFDRLQGKPFWIWNIEEHRQEDIRMKKLFAGSSKGLVAFDSKETVVELNKVKIEAFPSHHLDAMRGLPNVSFILLDEADFFPPGQQQDARDVCTVLITLLIKYVF
jgi:hypothetical protein